MRRAPTDVGPHKPDILDAPEIRRIRDLNRQHCARARRNAASIAGRLQRLCNAKLALD